MIQAVTSELLANFTCGACGQYSLSEPAHYSEIEVTAVCPKCGVENFL